MIGDGKNDILAGKNAGCKTALIGNEDYGQDITVDSLFTFVNKNEENLYEEFRTKNICAFEIINKQVSDS